MARTNGPLAGIATALFVVLGVALTGLSGGCSGANGPTASHPTVGSPPASPSTVEQASAHAGSTTSTAKRATTTAGPTTVHPTTPTTRRATVPTTSKPAGAVASACSATDNDLGKKLLAYAKSKEPSTPVNIGSITHASSDHTWARASLVPIAVSFDTLIVISHCVGSQWTVVTSGTRPVGCRPPVPTEIGKEIGVGC